MNFSKNRDFTIILWTDQNISSDVFNNTRNIEIRDLSRYCILTNNQSESGLIEIVYNT